MCHNGEMSDTSHVKLVWRLRGFLARRGVSVYKLAQTMPGNFRANRAVLYRVTDGDTVRASGETLAGILTGLLRLGLVSPGLLGLEAALVEIVAVKLEQN